MATPDVKEMATGRMEESNCPTWTVGYWGGPKWPYTMFRDYECYLRWRDGEPCPKHPVTNSEETPDDD